MLQAPAYQPTIAPQGLPAFARYVPVELNSSPKTRPVIGLSWRAEPEDLRRSVPVRLAASLVNDLPCDVEVLQQSVKPAEAQEFPLARSRSLLEMADIMAGLDLVITVDTVVAHMATAMRRPTWLLLHANSDGRWLFPPAELEWIPSMRVYEQPHAGDWLEVIQRVADDLCLCCRGESFVLT
jgi:hypothetical protein